MSDPEKEGSQPSPLPSPRSTPAPLRNTASSLKMALSRVRSQGRRVLGLEAFTPHVAVAQMDQRLSLGAQVLVVLLVVSGGRCGPGRLCYGLRSTSHAASHHVRFHQISFILYPG